MLGCCGRKDCLRCAYAKSARLGLDAGDGFRIGSYSMLSEIRLGYGVNGWKSEKNGLTVGGCRTFGESLLLARILLDKDNPATESEG